jgi:hypothetical protein
MSSHDLEYAVEQEDNDMAGAKSRDYGRMRRTALVLCQGPEYIQIHDESHSFGGRGVLHLALRKGTSMQPIIETRTIYVDVGDPAQENAVLRAVYWDSQAARQNNPDGESLLKIPGTFVQVSVAQTQQWVAAFDRLNIALLATVRADDSLPICTLRIERDNVYSAFAKTWQVIDGENTDLNHVWQDIWNQMARLLPISAVVTDVEEFFPCHEPGKDAYAYQAYQPTITLP